MTTSEDPILKKIQPASFRKVPFWVPAENVSRGNKIVPHEYPNQDIRYVEYLGKIPPIINLTCIISGKDFVNNRLNFENALEEIGPGELVHPIYGAIDVIAGAVSVSSSSKEAGQFIFNVVFYESNGGEINPVELATSKDDIKKKSADLAAKSLTVADLKPPTDFLGLGAFNDKLNEMMDKVETAIRSITGPIESALAEVNSIIETIRFGYTGALSSISAVKDSFDTLFTGINVITDKIEDLSKMWSDLADFGTEDDEEAPTSAVSSRTKPVVPGSTSTAKRLDRESNDYALTELMRNTSLGYLMEANSGIEDQTIEDLESRDKRMDDLFKSMFINNKDAVGLSEDSASSLDKMPSIANDPDVRKSMMDLRVSSRKSSNLQAQNAWKTSEIEVRVMPLSLLTHQYYGNLDNIDTIVSLNADNNNSNSRDIVKIIKI